MNKSRIRRFRNHRISARSTVISKTAKRADTSRQIHQEDRFSTSAIGGVLPLTPPYDPNFLYSCTLNSNMLKQCITAYVTNIAESGYTVTKIREGQEVNESEKQELQSFIDAANADESLSTVQAKIVEDYETYG